MNLDAGGQHGGYSRLGTVIFVLIMAFPFVALGWELASEPLPTFALYVGAVVVFISAILIALIFAPTLRAPDPPPTIDIESFDSEKHGIPW